MTAEPMRRKRNVNGRTLARFPTMDEAVSYERMRKPSVARGDGAPPSGLGLVEQAEADCQ
jgi:hypothetical protein